MSSDKPIIRIIERYYLTAELRDNALNEALQNGLNAEICYHKKHMELYGFKYEIDYR